MDGPTTTSAVPMPVTSSPPQPSVSCNGIGAARHSARDTTSTEDDAPYISVRIGDVTFKVPDELVARQPETMLGAVAAHRGDMRTSQIVCFDRSVDVFRAILRFYATGMYPYQVDGVTWREYLQDMDYWGIYPPEPDVAAEMREQVHHHISIVAAAIRSSKLLSLDRLKAGYTSAVRFVTPTYSQQPIEQTQNLIKQLEQLEASMPTMTAEDAFAVAIQLWYEHSGSEMYYRSIIRGAEKFLSPARGATIQHAIQAAKTALDIYCASALVTNGPLAQHYLRREFGREGLDIRFTVSLWPEDTGDEIDPLSIPNPYEDCPELGYGAVIAKLWAQQLTGSPEPAVWKVGAATADRERLQAAGIRARKGVAYLLIDVMPFK